MKHIEERVAHALEIHGHWSFKVVAGLWGLVGVLTMARDNLLSPEGQKRYATLALLPKWPLYVWIIGLLVILLVMVFEGSFRAARKQRLALEGSNQSDDILPPPPPLNAQATVSDSGNSNATATGNTLTVLIPQSPPPSILPIYQEDLPVKVEFAPWEGQFEKMYLTVTNRGAKQSFQAQCRLVGRRNDPNPQQLRSFDLNWEYGGLALQLMPGQSGNLLIASTGEDRIQGTEWMRLEAASGPAPDSHWGRGDKNLPAYDIEITVLGRKSSTPQVEHFTVRAGKNRALEMFKRYVSIMSPDDGDEVSYRHIVTGIVSPHDSRVQVYIQGGNSKWYHQGDITATIGFWQINCWFGSSDSDLGGEYRVVAVANGGIVGKELHIVPKLGTMSKEIQVRRTSN